MRQFVFLLLFSILTQNQLIAQCQFTLDSYSHVNCYSDNTGSIDVSFTDPNISFWWNGPNGFTSNSKNLSGLFAGDYTLIHYVHLKNLLILTLNAQKKVTNHLL